MIVIVKYNVEGSILNGLCNAERKGAVNLKHLTGTGAMTACEKGDY